MIFRTAALVVLLFFTPRANDCLADLRDDALVAAKKVVDFYSRQVATEGGYLWRYSADLKLREGEGKVTGPTVWVQPPGTPAVGEAYLALYEATREPMFLDAARAVAEALRRGQLRSGGWTDHIDFDAAERARTPYRIDQARKKQKGYSSLDDDKSQSAIRFLVKVDRALDFKDAAIHEMSTFALGGLLRAQYPNGGFPQVWDEPERTGEFPARPAAYPPRWERQYPGHGNYWFRYTLNDDLMPDVMHALFLAHDVYGDPRYREAAIKAADFLLLAQLPDPQPAWAQQYDFDMQPAWARKFEPPAVTGGESQGVLRILLEVYPRTGERKYLQPVPRALAYLKKSLLPDGRLARFYELQSNRPLYFTKDYALTYDDSDMPTHYGFKLTSKLDQIEAEYEALLTASNKPPAPKPRRITPGMEERVRVAIDGLDDRGAWVTDDNLRYHQYTGPVIDMAVAVRNLNLLAEYLSLVRAE